MNDKPDDKDQPENDMLSIAEKLNNLSTEPIRDKPWPFDRPNKVERLPSSEWPGSPNYAGGVPGDAHEEAPAYIPKNSDVPRAGELSSQVFNDLTTRIISELQEAVEAQINDAISRRQHAVLQMESLRAEVDKVFGEFEAQAKIHEKKVKALAEAVQKKVKADTDQMMLLSNRLREFADTVNVAHDKFIKE
jgi:hypothetical protein